ncbi:TMhelix containing protein [Oceanospirillum phage vB_OliS_GJ44]|nr:TMhelix containing protein [Oceanospirillum phage vB_OliS_GJ44]
MKWSDITGLIGKAAPMLGGVIGGPAGAAVGSMVASALGVEDTPDAVAQAIKNDPDAMLKLKQLEADEAENLRKYQFNVLDAELKDKQSAREAHKHNHMPAVICVALTFLVGAGAYLLFSVVIPEGNKEIAYLLFGTLLAKWGDSIAYWVGTTRSSAEKTKMIKQ